MTDERRWVAAFLVLTASMGVLDAVSLLHLSTFTGYMTGTVILIGITFARGATLSAPPLVALGALMCGALLGGRLVRRPHELHRLVADILTGVAALVAASALLDGLAGERMSLGVVALLGLAMGLQHSATRHAGVADMSMPAATLVLHGLAHDSRLAGGTAVRTWRRTGILVGLLAGAALGALLSAWHPWAGLVFAAALITLAAAALQAGRRPDDRQRRSD